jgi:thiol-disulfide isomerase/thioredoxin
MRTAILVLLSTVAAFGADALHLSPAFTINRPGAPAIQLSQYRGKIVALAFILTTCPHCQALTGTLIPIAKEYAPKGVQFVECAFNAGAEQLVPQFVQQFQPPFPVGWSTDPAVRSYLQYSVMDTRNLYVPHMVFLDRKGMIRGDYPGESPFFQNPDANIRAELEKLLKPAAVAPSPKK